MKKNESAVNSVKTPPLWLALVPIMFMVIVLPIGIMVYDATPHVPLILTTIVAVIVVMSLGHSWESIEKRMLKTIALSLQAIVIILIIGALVGLWLAAGIVPSMIYYGLDILSPTFFLVAACMISAVVSLAAGNSWAAAGTVGVALIGIGQGLGVPLPMVAGAIISGVYFGDKMSPLSETTNLAPAIVGTNLFDHIRNIAWTTGPAFLIALVLYLILGFKYSGSGSSMSEIALIQNALSGHFVISPFLLIPPLFILVVLIFKIQAIPGLTFGAAMGAFCALFVQGNTIGEVIEAIQFGFTANTGTELVDELLNQGGIEGVLSVVAFVIIALAFGGVLEQGKILETILSALVSKVKRTGSLISTTVATCYTTNIIGCEQYLSIVIPGRMYLNEYKKRGLHPKLLSRTLEDAGTMSSPLIPWTTCGIFMYSVLGVHPFQYAPYAFLAYTSGAMAILYGYLNIKISRLPIEEQTEVTIEQNEEMSKANV
ncbi:Na+/H+ antiporter NhaC [Bacillus sp. B190/17]|uniref:Na+/H+ antiporter NhaC n=1 Tax=Bacillus lumedeiriae TaxID=3058829 RepID=A0ABW8I8B5_9BACI